jgi:hypothetical protein
MSAPQISLQMPLYGIEPPLDGLTSQLQRINLPECLVGGRFRFQRRLTNPGNRLEKLVNVFDQFVVVHPKSP